MAAWLSSDWATEVADAVADWAPADAAAPVRVSFTVLGGPDGDVTGTVRLWAGGTGAEREVAVTLPAAETKAVINGELAPSVAFMRGRLKTSGDPGALLEVLQATAGPSWDEARSRVAALDGGA